MIKLLYWAFVATDLAALCVFAVLGLAAASSSRTSPLVVLLLLFVLPAIPLAGSVWVYLRASSPVWRRVAFALAAAPIVITLAAKAYTDARISSNTNARGDLTFFRAGPQRDLVEAIRRNDAADVRALLPNADVNAAGMDGMTPLVMAMRQLRTTPSHHDVLNALLAAGADPNAGTQYEIPLEMALQIDDRTGAGRVELLLAAGADPNQRNSSGVPVFFAAAGNGSPERTLDLLLTKGADLRATASNGETILFYAATASNWRAVRRLLERGADWHQGRSFKGLTFPELVDEVARERQSLQTDDGQPRDDDGFPDVVAFLRGQQHAR